MPTKAPPPIKLPRVTNIWLWMNPEREISTPCGRNIAIPKRLWFAILCSNPLPMKANRHQKIMINLAVSLCVRKEIHTAKQTSQLHNIPRRKASFALRDIFIPAALRTKTCAASVKLPPSTTNQPRNIEPIKLPIKHMVNNMIIGPMPTRLASRLIAKIILFPVKSSDPANMTRLSATPKEAPMTSFKYPPPPAAAIGPPIEKIKVMPNPR